MTASTREIALEQLVKCLDAVILLAAFNIPPSDDLVGRIHALRAQIKENHQ